eukprot:m.202601 g.202601  ORF g.202601 m.202601 type:complete len:359 (+) comp17722_c2_seq2:351-1427(+)
MNNSPSGHGPRARQSFSGPPSPVSPGLAGAGAGASPSSPMAAIPRTSSSSSSSSAHWRYCPAAPGNVRGTDIFCQGTLQREQLNDCSRLLSSDFVVGNEHAAQWDFPPVAIKPIELAFDVLKTLEKSPIGVREMRMSGSAVHGLMCDKCRESSSDSPKSIDIRYFINSRIRNDLFATRDMLLDSLVTLLPAAIARKSRHMLAASYVQNMNVTSSQRAPTDPAFAQYIMPGPSGSASLAFYFVQIDNAEQDVLQLRLPRDVLKSWYDETCGISTSPTKVAASPGSPSSRQVPEFICDYRTHQPALRSLQLPPPPTTTIVGKVTELFGHIVQCTCCYSAGATMGKEPAAAPAPASATTAV